MRVPVHQYLNNIPVQDLIPFYIKFLRDIQSVSDYLAENYVPETCLSIDPPGAYINEHGRLVVMYILYIYLLDTANSARRILPFNRFWTWSNVQIRGFRRLSLHYFSLDMPRKDLIWVYYVICCYAEKNHVQIPYQKSQRYVPGSILTVRGQTLVGGVRDRSRSYEWNAHWSTKLSPYECPLDFVFCLPSTDSGSIVVDPLAHSTSKFEGNTIPILCAGTVPHYIEIYLHSSAHISTSWIAQASHLDTSLRSRGYLEEDDLYQIYGGFLLCIEPLDKHKDFHLCDTFIVEDPHTLSLFIRPPVVDYSSHEVSIPVLSWLYDGNLEMSLEEAEGFFGFKLTTSWESWSSPCSSVFTAIPALNAEYGFDPAKGGADVCERHG
ncbi:hypothetical protein EDD18DRAFT_172240 [Armillaria luteobubalina]|uniref:Uncharacterized protein n=1 Tax=Armillaria luteobubalina TaxID=153913 RepID=A0AA39TPE1_9AGAR|nr:hypothetical protein EDD18DRAFT_172240 [Armillaria luteobubalina]